MSPSVRRPASRRRLAGVVLALVLATVPSPGRAGPPTEQSKVAIPPDREQLARKLLEPLADELDRHASGLELRGPSIERDRIKWWLRRGEQTRAMLLLLPRNAGQPDDPRSKSFAIEIAWAPEVEPEPAELALLDAAVEAVQANDQGGFYVILVDTLIRDVTEAPASTPETPVAEDPEHMRLLWSVKLVGVALLAGFAMAATLRPRRADELGSG